MSKIYKNYFKPRVNAPIINNEKFNSLSFGEKTPCQYSNGSKNVTYTITNILVVYIYIYHERNISPNGH
jgi:hypothetical protein